MYVDGLPRSSADIPRLPGSPDTLRGCASDLRELAADLDVSRIAAEQLTDLTDGTSWQGAGFDAFRSKVEQNPKGSDLSNAQSIMHAAAGALDNLATGVAECQSRIDWCRQRIDSLQLPDGEIPPELQTQVETIRTDADLAYEDYDRHVTTCGDRFEEITGRTVYAQPPPGLFERIGNAIGDVVEFVGEFAIGIVEGVVEIAKGIYALADLLVHPSRWDEAWNTMVQIIQFAIENPGEFLKMVGKAIVDWDTLMESPGRWLGKLVPSILLAVATGGAGAVASGLGRVSAMASRFSRMGRLANKLDGAAGVARRVDNFGNVARRTGLTRVASTATQHVVGGLRSGAQSVAGGFSTAMQVMTGQNVGFRPLAAGVALAPTGTNHMPSVGVGGSGSGGTATPTTNTSNFTSTSTSTSTGSSSPTTSADTSTTSGPADTTTSADRAGPADPGSTDPGGAADAGGADTDTSDTSAATDAGGPDAGGPADAVTSDPGGSADVGGPDADPGADVGGSTDAGSADAGGPADTLSSDTSGSVDAESGDTGPTADAGAETGGSAEVDGADTGAPGDTAGVDASGEAGPDAASDTPATAGDGTPTTTEAPASTVADSGPGADGAEPAPAGDTPGTTAATAGDGTPSAGEARPGDVPTADGTTSDRSGMAAAGSASPTRVGPAVGDHHADPTGDTVPVDDPDLVQLGGTAASDPFGLPEHHPDRATPDLLDAPELQPDLSLVDAPDRHPGRATADLLDAPEYRPGRDPQTLHDQHVGGERGADGGDRDPDPGADAPGVVPAMVAAQTVAAVGRQAPNLLHGGRDRGQGGAGGGRGDRGSEGAGGGDGNGDDATPTSDRATPASDADWGVPDLPDPDLGLHPPARPKDREYRDWPEDIRAEYDAHRDRHVARLTEDMGPDAGGYRDYVDEVAQLFGEGGDLARFWDADRGTFDESAWEAASVEDRRDLLQRLEDIRARADSSPDQGPPPFRVEVVAQDLFPEGSEAWTDLDRWTIYFSESLGCEDAVRLAAHEGFHVHQLRAIYEASGPTPPSVPHPDASGWEMDQSHYVSPDEDWFQYRHQSFEVDGYLVGDKFIDDVAEAIGGRRGPGGPFASDVPRIPEPYLGGSATPEPASAPTPEELWGVPEVPEVPDGPDPSMDGPADPTSPPDGPAGSDGVGPDRGPDTTHPDGGGPGAAAPGDGGVRFYHAESDGIAGIRQDDHMPHGGAGASPNGDDALGATSDRAPDAPPRSRTRPDPDVHGVTRDPEGRTVPDPDANPSLGTVPDPDANPNVGTVPDPDANPNLGTVPDPRPGAHAGTGSGGTLPDPHPDPDLDPAVPGSDPRPGTSPDPDTHGPDAADAPAGTTPDASRAGTRPDVDVHGTTPDPDVPTRTAPDLAPGDHPRGGTSPDPDRHGTTPDPDADRGTVADPEADPQRATTPDPDAEADQAGNDDSGPGGPPAGDGPGEAPTLIDRGESIDYGDHPVPVGDPDPGTDVDPSLLSDAELALRSKVVQRVEPLDQVFPDAGHTNEVNVVTFTDGTRAIYKPAAGSGTRIDGRPQRNAIPPGSLADREVGFYRYAEDIGCADIVPPTTFWNGPRGLGSLQLLEEGFTFHSKPRRGKISALFTRPQRSRAAALDYGGGNTDRNIENIGRGQDTRAKLIDNGLTAPENGTSPIRSSFVTEHIRRADQTGKGFTPKTLEDLRSADLDRMRRRQPPGISDDAVQGIVDRTVEMRTHGRVTGESWDGSILDSWSRPVDSIPLKHPLPEFLMASKTDIPGTERILDPASQAASTPHRGTIPDPAANPHRGTIPDPEANPRHGTVPDPGANPHRGTVPDLGANPRHGTIPDPDADPHHGTVADPGRGDGGVVDGPASHPGMPGSGQDSDFGHWPEDIRAEYEAYRDRHVDRLHAHIGPDAGSYQRYVDEVAELFGEGGELARFWDPGSGTFDESAWAATPIPERVDFLQRLEDIRARADAQPGQEPSPYTIVVVPHDWMPGGETAVTNHRIQTVVFSDRAGIHDAVTVGAHEGFHVHQHRVTEEASGPTPPARPHPDASVWEMNESHYVQPPTVAEIKSDLEAARLRFLEYVLQAHETDAYLVGFQFKDDVTQAIQALRGDGDGPDPSGPEDTTGPAGPNDGNSATHPKARSPRPTGDDRDPAGGDGVTDQAGAGGGGEGPDSPAPADPAEGPGTRPDRYESWPEDVRAEYDAYRDRHVVGLTEHFGPDPTSYRSYVDEVAELFDEGGELARFWDRERATFDDAAWAETSLDERRELLQRLEDIRARWAAPSGQRPYTVEILPERHPLAGLTDSAAETIGVSRYLDCEDAIRTVVHEGFHGHQDRIVDQERAATPDRAMANFLGLTSPSSHPHASQWDLDDSRYSLPRESNPPDEDDALDEHDALGVDDDPDYDLQAVEIDAYLLEDVFVDDLTRAIQRSPGDDGGGDGPDELDIRVNELKQRPATRAPYQTTIHHVASDGSPLEYDGEVKEIVDGAIDAALERTREHPWPNGGLVVVNDATGEVRVLDAQPLEPAPLMLPDPPLAPGERVLLEYRVDPDPSASIHGPSGPDLWYARQLGRLSIVDTRFGRFSFDGGSGRLSFQSSYYRFDDWVTDLADADLTGDYDLRDHLPPGIGDDHVTRTRAAAEQEMRARQDADLARARARDREAFDDPKVVGALHEELRAARDAGLPWPSSGLIIRDGDTGEVRVERTASPQATRFVQPASPLEPGERVLFEYRFDPDPAAGVRGPSGPELWHAEHEGRRFVLDTPTARYTFEPDTRWMQIAHRGASVPFKLGLDVDLGDPHFDLRAHFPVSVRVFHAEIPDPHADGPDPSDHSDHNHPTGGDDHGAPAAPGEPGGDGVDELDDRLRELGPLQAPPPYQVTIHQVPRRPAWYLANYHENVEIKEIVDQAIGAARERARQNPQDPRPYGGVAVINDAIGELRIYHMQSPTPERLIVADPPLAPGERVLLEYHVDLDPAAGVNGPSGPSLWHAQQHGRLSILDTPAGTYEFWGHLGAVDARSLHFRDGTSGDELWSIHLPDGVDIDADFDWRDHLTDEAREAHDRHTAGAGHIDASPADRPPLSGDDAGRADGPGANGIHERAQAHDDLGGDDDPGRRPKARLPRSSGDDAGNGDVAGRSGDDGGPQGTGGHVGQDAGTQPLPDEAIEPAPAHAATAPELTIDHPSVREALDAGLTKAWHDTEEAGRRSWYDRQENGGAIIADDATGDVHILPFPPGHRDHMPWPSPEALEGFLSEHLTSPRVVAMYHTHPGADGGYEFLSTRDGVTTPLYDPDGSLRLQWPGPSPHDFRLAQDAASRGRGYVQVVRAEDGIYTYDPDTQVLTVERMANNWKTGVEETYQVSSDDVDEVLGTARGVLPVDDHLPGDLFTPESFRRWGVDALRDALDGLYPVLEAPDVPTLARHLREAVLTGRSDALDAERTVRLLHRVMSDLLGVDLPDSLFRPDTLRQWLPDALDDVTSIRVANYIPGGHLAAHEGRILSGPYRTRTLTDHVELADDELRARLADDPGLEAASTFESEAQADEYVARVVRARYQAISDWLAGNPEPTAADRLDVVVPFADDVGRVLPRGAQHPVPGRGVRLVLEAASPGAPFPFHIVQAHPTPHMFE